MSNLFSGKTILASASALAVLAGVQIYNAAIPHDANAPALSDGVAFLNPIDFIQSVCGQSPTATRDRRAFFIAAGRAIAQEAAATIAPHDRFAPTPGIAYDVTGNDDAQNLFNAGLAHMWNFNHGAAIEAFKAGQAADPACAMCFWGEAFSYGPNINAPMDPESVAPAYAALQGAVALTDSATDKEKALIEALSKRYSEQPTPDRSALDTAFADAMDALALRFPEDDFIAALAAEAAMDTQAWDYWEADGRTPKGRTARTVSLIEGVLARNPAYQPAIHLYIHITEATNNPYRAVKYAETLDELSPGLGHLIHMPSHSFYRIGRFKDSIEYNIRAVKADEAFLASGTAHPLYQFGYYTHNVHFVMTAALMAGDGDTALAMAKKLDEKLPTDMALAVPFAQPIKAAPYFAMARFADPTDILALPAPDAAAPYLVAMHAYARGEALAKLGRTDEAEKEAARIFDLHDKADLSALTENGIPAHDVLKIAGLTVQARTAQAKSDLPAAIEAMEEAVAVQKNITYTEPPYWYYPAKQTLAAMVLAHGDAARAEQLFLEALVASPNNGAIYYGLSETYGVKGDKKAKRFAREMMHDAWLGEDAPVLSRM